MLPWLLAFRFCSLIAPIRKSPSRRWLLIIGTWLFVGPCLLKSWKTGKDSLPYSPRSRRSQIRWFGLSLPLVAPRSNLYILSLLVVPPPIDSLISGRPVRHQRLRFSSGKPSEVAFLLLIRSKNAMGRARNSVTCVGLWKTLITSFSTVFLPN